MNDATPDSASLPWANGLYSILRHGTTLTTCDSEPVKTPGCIQAHGVLLVLRLADLTILQGSDNTQQFSGNPWQRCSASASAASSVRSGRPFCKTCCCANRWSAMCFTPSRLRRAKARQR